MLFCVEADCTALEFQRICRTGRLGKDVDNKSPPTCCSAKAGQLQIVAALQLLNLVPFVCWLIPSKRQLQLQWSFSVVICYSSVAHHSQSKAFRFVVTAQLFWLSMTSYPIGVAVVCRQVQSSPFPIALFWPNILYICYSFLHWLPLVNLHPE